MKALDGRVVVVVGAGSVGDGWSNGQACAVSYARAGATVVCADIELARAEATACLIEDEGGKSCSIAVDATDEMSVRSLIEESASRYGRLDVVHNNVGVGGTSGLPDQIPPGDWQREIDQNLTSAYLGIRCAVPFMRQQGGGSILNTSSLLAIRWLRRPTTAYTTAKAAVEALTRSCAAGYGRDNIRVNCIRIGFSETPAATRGLAHLSPEERERELNRTRAKVPLRSQHGNPFDVAAAAVFLATDSAGHITGAVLDVDGGLSVAPI